MQSIDPTEIPSNDEADIRCFRLEFSMLQKRFARIKRYAEDLLEAPKAVWRNEIHAEQLLDRLSEERSYQ